jgi:hypothetical protein
VSTRRILVAADGSSERRAVLAAAARLAASMEAELAGLFVEDVELLRLAGLPFAHEASVSSGIFRRLEAPDVERQFRLAAEQAREALREAASGWGLRSSFRVARGRVIPEVLAAALEASVAAAGKRSGHGRPGQRLGATARGLIAHVTAPILVGGRKSFPGGPAVVLSAASEVPEDALRFAALLARAFEASEIVVMDGRAGPGQAEVHGIPVRRRGVPSVSSGGIRALPEVASASAVILVRPEARAGDELLVALAEAVTCPVFVIGSSGLAELLSA